MARHACQVLQRGREGKEATESAQLTCYKRERERERGGGGGGDTERKGREGGHRISGLYRKDCVCVCGGGGGANCSKP